MVKIRGCIGPRFNGYMYMRKCHKCHPRARRVSKTGLARIATARPVTVGPSEGHYQRCYHHAVGTKAPRRPPVRTATGFGAGGHAPSGAHPLALRTARAVHVHHPESVPNALARHKGWCCVQAVEAPGICWAGDEAAQLQLVPAAAPSAAAAGLEHASPRFARRGRRPSGGRQATSCRLATTFRPQGQHTFRP